MADARIDVFWHAGVLDHDTGRGVFDAPSEPFMAIDEAHPENADRLRNMHAILEKGPLAARLDWHAGRLAGADELTTFHSPAHVEKMRAADAAGGERFLKTTLIAPGPYDACRAAAGTAPTPRRPTPSGRSCRMRGVTTPPHARRS